MTTDTLEPARTLLSGEQLLPGLVAWELLGGGSHCESWLAWSDDLWSPVVVKLPRPAARWVLLKQVQHDKLDG